MNDYLNKLKEGLSPEQQLSRIVQDSMCIGCGLCESIVPNAAISLEIAANGFERPVINSQISQAQMDDIFACCPATKVEGMPPHLNSEESKVDEVWGQWHEMYFSYSGEADTRHLASTGGVLTSLALYLIESGEVDFILHAKASQTEPSFGEPTISRTREDVIAAAGSRYGPTATLRNIVKTLEEANRNDEKFAFIGTPCDVSALRNYAQTNPHVDEHCLYMLTMVCGGFMSPRAMQASIEDKGVSYEQVASIRYRGYGCPGPTTITLKNGEQHQFTYLEFWGDDESSWGLPPRCKVCPDGIGDSADIAAADCWDGGSPNAEESLTDPGRNAVIVRTERASQLMKRAINANYLNRDEDLSPQDLNRFQPHQEAKKRAVYARFLSFEKANMIFPQTQRLRLRKLWALNTAEFNLAETNGTRMRVEQGKFAELPE